MGTQFDLRPNPHVAAYVRSVLRYRGASAVAVAALLSMPVLADTAPSNGASSSQPDEVLNEVVVTGQRAALESAQHLKEVSPEIVDSIVAQDIGKLPDRSVMEVLQRVPGITIDHTYRDIAGNVDPEHFQVEGAGLTIRGLSYVRSEINGRDSFTANGGRSLSFDDVPPELLAAVDVFKNPSAEQIEGGVGGLVNLRTAKPLDFADPRVSGTVGGAWGDLSRGNVKPSASVLLSDRWHTGIGEIGVLADFAYSEVLQRTDGMEGQPLFPRIASLEPTNTWIPAGQTVWVPGGGVSFRSLKFKRTREGVYTALQWRPTDGVETSLSYFSSVYKFHWDESGFFSGSNPYNVVPAPGTSFAFNPNGTLTQGTIGDTADNGLPFGDDTRSADRRSVTTDLSWDLVWHATDRLRLRTDLQLVRSNTHADDYTVGAGVNVPWESFSVNGDVPSLSLPQSYMANPANYYWGFTQDGQAMSHGKEWAWRGDADYDLGGGFFKTIGAGVRVADRNAETDLTEPGSGYQWAAVSQTWMLGWNLPTLAYMNQFPAPNTTIAFSNFLNGRVPVPPAVVFPGVSLTTGWPGSFALLQGFRTNLCQQLNPTCNYAWTPASFGQAPGAPPAGGLNKQDERTTAAYLTVGFGADIGGVPYDGNVGVRVVRTADTASGFTTMSGYSLPTQPPAGHSLGEYVPFPGFVQPVSAKNDYTDVLPSFNVRFHWRDHLQSRLAISEGMARPDFSKLQAFTTLTSGITNGVQTFTGTANGNPELKPTKAFQIDGTLEWYFAPSGSVTADVFYKHLTDVVINRVLDVPVTDAFGGSHPFTTTGPINGASGKIKGLELAYQQYYDFLPAFLRGFGTQLNFTYLDNHQTLDQPVNSPYCTSTSSAADNPNLNFNGCDTDGRTFGDLPLVNLSKYAYNAALLYDRGPLSARLAYSWRSKYLLGVNVYPVNGTNGVNTDPNSPNYGQHNVAWGLPLYADAYGELDASVFYKITANVTVGFEALNVTDSIYRELQTQHIATSTFAWYGSGRTYSVQLRATF